MLFILPILSLSKANESQVNRISTGEDELEMYDSHDRHVTGLKGKLHKIIRSRVLEIDWTT